MNAGTHRTACLADAVAHGLETIEQCADPLPVVCEHLGAAVSADILAYGRLITNGAHPELRFWPGVVDTELMMQATREIPDTHPLLAHWLSGHNDAHALSALVTNRRAWRNTAAYSVLSVGMGCTENAGIRIDSGPNTLKIIGFARQGDLSAEELRFLQASRGPVNALHRHAIHLAAWRRSLGADHASAVEAAADLGLTARELDVLHLLCRGHLATSIASRLAISTRTVHRHLSNLYGKLGVHDRLTAVVIAQERGLIARDPVARPA